MKHNLSTVVADAQDSDPPGMVAQCCQEWWLSVAAGTASVPRTLNTGASTSPTFKIRRIRLGPLATGVGCCRILHGGLYSYSNQSSYWHTAPATSARESALLYGVLTNH